MLKLKKIAITGGVASGKTSVCQVFKELGAFVVSADEIVHELLQADTDLGQQILRQFGRCILKNGKISRTLIAEKVFKDPDRLAALEELLHPIVFRKIEDLYQRVSDAGTYSSFVVEMPLLFETCSESFYDCVITVLCDEKTARYRFEQSGFKPEEYDLRMKRQLDPLKKAARSTYTIQNNGPLSNLKNQVIEINKLIHA